MTFSQKKFFLKKFQNRYLEVSHIQKDQFLNQAKAELNSRSRMKIAMISSEKLFFTCFGLILKHFSSKN